jgi:anti-anti-sigma regulatory factor
LPATLEQQADHTLIRLEGECTLATAAELKNLLIEALALGGDLRLDLRSVEEIDITAMQLLWAAEREANRAGSKFAGAVPDAIVSAAREAGFDQFPGMNG